ncbi:MAG TPA: HAMP domain-containing protein, partial [Candidatus Limnocylindrales bacterium]|nr:HAMP domain-containing protein [Candidatus Limnocylindrales bacterium]
MASATPSPSAEAGRAPAGAASSPATSTADRGRAAARLGRTSGVRRQLLRRLRRLTPRTLQARLTVAFAAVVAATLVLVATFVINRVGAYFDQQQEDDLLARAGGVAQYVVLIAESTSSVRAGNPVVSATGVVDPAVVLELSRSSQQQIMADHLAQSDVEVQVGLLVGPDKTFEPAANGAFTVKEVGQPEPGQTREHVTSQPVLVEVTSATVPYGVQVSLLDPYTFRASAMANLVGLLLLIGVIALGIAVVVAATLARRFTTPIRRLTEASRDIGEGDLARRIPPGSVRAGSTEVAELGLQFNTMAERLQESVETIRHDRDRSREFLADVSHE